jgi:chromosome segregation protein
LAERESAEQHLNVSRSAVGDLDHQLAELQKQRIDIDACVQERREALEAHRVDRQELVVRRQTIHEQISEHGETPDRLVESLPEDATESDWQGKLEALARRIERIGPVNLVAIEEFEEQSERKTYLDKQHADLSEALATLEGVIRKIDKETRERFRETFDALNKTFQEYFPKLFGGGHATIELTDDDMLTAGVSVMARPPGKRNSSIQLLSGGEKAMTAVALLFSFFTLNPAPFCFLDEVDAPLDDANVLRYTTILRSLAERTQLIYITHNKITMEAADVLIGVTMGEPGVSRLVAVDVDQALEMASQ